MSEAKVYGTISAVMRELAKEGISKARKNEQQGYKFRGIDDVYNALSAALSANGLVILPTFANRTVVERTTAKGGAIFYVTVDGTFTLASVNDGSTVTVGPFYGEAMDTGDKATNKAMSAAYKYMAMEVFCIPTEGDNDADATTHEVAAKAITERKGSPWTKELVDAGDAAASEGMAAYQAWWAGLPPETRSVLVQTSVHTTYKKLADRVDHAAADAAAAKQESVAA